ncbi:CBU_0592 family membrane protein [Mucilaginibacter lacusdianchii]|uniref:CBU_0592 family membrane protein n=1 Tax=Mucilaginibacter lacusdianchii TaxID=2684211 RepID=UPI003F71F56E
MLFDILGWLGALLFLVSYFLLIIKKWRPTSSAFHWANIWGGIFVGASACYDSSYPSAFINFAWAIIALYGLYTDQFRKINL